MAKFEVHCDDCLQKLGKPFPEVHKWLDACYRPGMGLEHRDIRHNLEGIEEIRKMFGDEAVEAAKLHIFLDWAYDPIIPKNKEDAALHRLALIERYQERKADALKNRSPYEE